MYVQIITYSYTSGDTNDVDIILVRLQIEVLAKNIVQNFRDIKLVIYGDFLLKELLEILIVLRNE